VGDWTVLAVSIDNRVASAGVDDGSFPILVEMQLLSMLLCAFIYLWTLRYASTLPSCIARIVLENCRGSTNYAFIVRRERNRTLNIAGT